MPCLGHLPTGGALKLPVQAAGLGPGLGFEVRSKAKTSSDGALERSGRDEVSHGPPAKTYPGPRPTWGPSLLPGRRQGRSQQWAHWAWGAQGLRRGLRNNQKQVMELATDRGLKADWGQGRAAGTCEGISGARTFFSTKLTPSGSRSSSLTTFLWGQPTWGTGQRAGQGCWAGLNWAGGSEATRQPWPHSTLSASRSASAHPPPGSLHEPL